MQRDPLHVQPREEAGREVQPGRRGRRGAPLPRIDGLIALGILQRLRDVRRQRDQPGRLAVETHEPATLAEMLEELDDAAATTRSKAPRRPRQRLPDVLVALLEQEDLPARRGDRDARGDHTRVVHDHERSGWELLRKIGEPAVADGARRTVVDQQPGLVATLDRPLCDQLLRQVVLELTAVHPVRTLASGPMDELREALRDGLRDEAAPIARRLAEVKGLSNNAARRLERIESTLDSERLARVDDLALLVELLTEGWRAMNARLDRIEAALARDVATIVPLRESA